MNTQTFDLVFLDPPYDTDMLGKALDNVSDFVPEGGTVICEHSADTVLPDELNGFSKYRAYKYGKTSVTIFRKD
jgi:16S rRNA G966 N2-methylase RsmD